MHDPDNSVREFRHPARRPKAAMVGGEESLSNSDHAGAALLAKQLRRFCPEPGLSEALLPHRLQAAGQGGRVQKLGGPE